MLWSSLPREHICVLPITPSAHELWAAEKTPQYNACMPAPRVSGDCAYADGNQAEAAGRIGQIRL